MSFVVSRSFGFSASHQLFGLAEGHKCARLHGHTYQVEVAIEGALDGTGMLIDFGRLDWVEALIHDHLDHRHLNDALEDNPTSENIALWIGIQTSAWLSAAPESPRLDSLQVRVAETPRTYASVAFSLR